MLNHVLFLYKEIESFLNFFSSVFNANSYRSAKVKNNVLSTLAGLRAFTENLDIEVIISSECHLMDPMTTLKDLFYTCNLWRFLRLFFLLCSFHSLKPGNLHQNSKNVPLSNYISICVLLIG